ncbi:MAG: hypothetical protein IPJ77_19105 [Planctomycetes bacterium]|nr:hypothetical protein [Planctomycetota bacterium]
MRKLERGRGKATDARAISCLWLDLDTLEGEHKKKALPKDTASAQALVADFPLPPSIVLHSGGGLYPLWLLDKPVRIDDAEERRRIAGLLKSWQAELLRIASEKGFDLDNTADLSRCLRAPGTLNAKYSPPRLVRALDMPDEPRRYAVEDFERVVPQIKTRVRHGTRKSPSGDAPPTTALVRAATLLGGTSKLIEEEQRVIGVELTTCPYCHGLETAGGVAAGTAHLVALTLTLRCKRASCAARDTGIVFENWAANLLESSAAAELRALHAQERAAMALYSEVGFADFFLRDHREDVRYCEALGGWLVYDGRRYVANASAVLRRARETSRRIVAEADEDDFKHAIKAQREASIRAMLKLAAAEVVLPVSAFDADPFLLNAPNGTIALRTGTLRPHRREDLITRCTHAEFHPEATCPLLDSTLAHITGGSAPFGSFLLRSFGYALTGDTREDSIFIFHGPRGNEGKTTLLGLLGTMLGDYARTIAFESLLSRRTANCGPRPDLVGLMGIRCVTASEVSEGRQFDAGVIKALSGGDEVAPRDHYKSPVPFRPSCKLFLCCNHVPRPDSDVDGGSRRRIRIIPFAFPFPDTEESKPFREALRTSKRAQQALLALAVRGCREWLEQGLGTCTEVEVARDEYWEGKESGAVRGDALNAFFRARCDFFEGGEETAAALRAALEEHCRGADHPLPSIPRLAAALEDRGCTKHRTGDTRSWRGVRLVRSEVGDACDGMTPAKETPFQCAGASTNTHAHVGRVLGDASHASHASQGSVSEPLEAGLPNEHAGIAPNQLPGTGRLELATGGGAS